MSLRRLEAGISFLEGAVFMSLLLPILLLLFGIATQLTDSYLIESLVHERLLALVANPSNESAKISSFVAFKKYIDKKFGDSFLAFGNIAIATNRVGLKIYCLDLSNALSLCNNKNVAFKELSKTLSSIKKLKLKGALTYQINSTNAIEVESSAVRFNLLSVVIPWSHTTLGKSLGGILSFKGIGGDLIAVSHTIPRGQGIYE
jgi:hypothetical protein